MTEKERYQQIINELENLNQFIRKTDKKVVNILNGADVGYSERFSIKWPATQLEGASKQITFLTVEQAEKFLITMKKQSQKLD